MTVLMLSCIYPLEETLYDKERTKGSQKNTDYSGYIGSVRGTGILRNQNKPDIQAGGNQRRAAVPLFSDEGNSVRRTGQDRSGRHAYANADQRREWFGFFYQFTKMLFSQVEKNIFIAKMFVFMGNVVQAEDIPEKLRKLAASVDTIAFCQNWVEAGQKDGSIRKGDVMALSNMYWCAIHGIMGQYALRPEIPLPEPIWLAGMLQNDKEPIH